MWLSPVSANSQFLASMEAVLPDFIADRLFGHAELAGCKALIAPRTLEGLADELALEPGDDVGELATVADPEHTATGLEIVGRGVGVEHGSGAHGEDALDVVLEL